MKKMAFALPFIALTAGNAWAVDPIQKQVTVTASIPTEAFYVEPVGGNWMNEPQDMSWNPVTESLQPIQKQLVVKSTTGPISAYLINDAVIASGSNSIDLDVQVAGLSLNTASQPLPLPDVSTPKTVEFRVSAKAPAANNYVAGNYQGIVGMMFETAAP